MDSEHIGVKPFALSLAAIALIEISAQCIMPNLRIAAMNWLGLTVTGVIRLVEIAAVLLIIRHYCSKGLSAIGLSRTRTRHGIRKGMIWSAGFGIVTALAGLGLYLAGINPIRLFRGPHFHSGWDILFYYLVGGLIAPVAEEICFRGVIYTFLRKWGVVWAAIATTVIFVLMHPLASVPIPQVVGGLVFAASFEIEKSLWVPIIIHATGNMAIFTLSLI